MSEYIKVTIKTTTQSADALCALLGDLGIGGFVIEDRTDFEDFVENCRDKYDYIDEELLNKPAETPQISFYLETEKSMETLAAVKTILSGLDKEFFGSLELSHESVNEEDWAETWKRFFKPTEVGDKLLIVPEWEDDFKTDRMVFKVNPGMVFGTGTHESTQLCLEAAEKYVKKGDKVLDLGSGSGILSVISMMLGAERACAVDIERASYEIALENALMNGIHRNSDAKVGDVTDDEFRSTLGSGYDIVFANIVSGVIIALAPYIKGFLADDGVFITSGIIDERKDEVLSALEANGLKLIKATNRRGWNALIMK